MTSAQLHVDPEAEVREGLWGGFVEVFRPDTLLRHFQDGVSDTLHLRVHGGFARENDHDQLSVNFKKKFIDLKKKPIPEVQRR